MSASVGMPVMKLDNNNHFGKDQTAHAGNARAVVLEALNERLSSDPDLDRDKTPNNVFIGERYGERLLESWNEMANAYRVVDKNGKEKKLRSDAGIGFAGIVKPNEEFMLGLTTEEQLRFLDDSVECIRAIYSSKKRNLVIDSIVYHFDEAVPHLHYFGHDPEYKLGKKLGLHLYKELNDTLYPKMMKERGWDVESHEGWDVDRANTLKAEEAQLREAGRIEEADKKANELKEMKENHIQRKKESGKSSRDYKKQKQKEEALKAKLLHENNEKIIQEITQKAEEAIDSVEVPMPSYKVADEDIAAIDRIIIRLENAAEKKPETYNENGTPVVRVNFLCPITTLKKWIDALKHIKNLFGLFKKEHTKMIAHKAKEIKREARERLNVRETIKKYQEQLPNTNIGQLSTHKKEEVSL